MSDDHAVELAGPDAKNSRAGNLWRDRDFLLLWVGQSASQLGAQTCQLTLPLIAVVLLHAGPNQIGLLRAAQQAPVLLLALFVGVWVDRWRQRDVLVLADFLRAAALVAIPLAYAVGLLRISVLYVVGPFVGIVTVFFDVAYQAYLLRLVNRNQLAQGNSMLESSRSAAQIGGPALSGALVSLLTAPIAIAASTFFFTFSFLTIRRIRRPESVPDGATRRVGMFGQMREGLRLVIGNVSLRTIAITSGIFNIAFAAFMTSYLLFLPRDLNLSAAEVGLCLASLGPGSLVGSVLAGRLPRRFGYGVVLVFAALIGDGVMPGVAAVHGNTASTVVLLMAINFLFGVFTQTVNVGITSIRQAVTPDKIQGRVAATIRFVGLGLTPFGSLLGGYLGDQLGPRTSLLLTAFAFCLSPLVIALSPLVRLGRTLPAPLRP